MKIRAILKMLAALLLIVSGFMLLSALVGLYYHEDWATIRAYVYPVLGSLAFGAAVFAFARGKEKAYFSARSGYVFVSLAWVGAAFLGCLPYLISGATGNLADAFFESMSGFTTTGASVFGDVESLPRSLLFWRSMTHWLGGMGIVVLTVAIFPLLGLGGLQIVDAESPGPTIDKITPRMAGTAKILWLIYVVMTFAQVVLLRLGGMGWFDSVCHTFGSVATGGFSTKNSSVGAWNSTYIHVVTTVFMVLAGANFSVYYRLWKRDFKAIVEDSEFKAYLGIVLVSSLAIALVLTANGGSFGLSLRDAAFQVASLLTTTGFMTVDYDQWPAFTKVILFALLLIGGSAGSTGGGIKVVRYLVLFKQTITELKYLIFPRGVFTVRLNGKPVPKIMIFDTATFFFLYIALAGFTALVVASSGYGIEESLGASLATLGNVGPGFGLIGPTDNYAQFPDYVVWTLNFAMLAGRLELYTVFAVFAAAYHRR